MAIEEMKQKKKEYGYTYSQISKLSGVPLGTVQKIFGGATESPRYETLMALTQIFRPKDVRYSSGKPYYSDMVCDSTSSYQAKKHGEYTVEDYYALPDDCRAELIDGVFYDMAAPRTTHQIMVGEIFMQLKLFIKSKNGFCIPMIAPAAVRLDYDNKTMVEPDIFVVCNNDKIRDYCFYGAPDFIIEVLSPSTRKKDMITKLNKYMNAGLTFAKFWNLLHFYMKALRKYKHFEKKADA